MKKTIDFIKKNSLPLALIILGCLIFYWVKDYKKVPSGIGPDFFPKIVATLMIGLSALCIVLEKNKETKGEFVQKKGALTKVLLLSAMLIVAIIIMKYVYSLLGVFLFLFSYFCLFANVKWTKSLILSAVGTVIIYAMIIILRISM